MHILSSCIARRQWEMTLAVPTLHHRQAQSNASTTYNQSHRRVHRPHVHRTRSHPCRMCGPTAQRRHPRPSDIHHDWNSSTCPSTRLRSLDQHRNTNYDPTHSTTTPVQASPASRHTCIDQPCVWRRLQLPSELDTRSETQLSSPTDSTHPGRPGHAILTSA